jgi:hypothetical protein
VPKIKRKGVPPKVINHLLDRIESRSINVKALEAFVAWLDKNPEVPAGEWFHRMEYLTVCGKGELVLTFLKPGQVAVGEEVE